jgi:hypothetical protein
MQPPFPPTPSKRPHPTPHPPPGPSFVYEMALARPVWRDVFAGFAPTPQIFRDPAMLTITIGILGVRPAAFGGEGAMGAQEGAARSALARDRPPRRAKK